MSLGYGVGTMRIVYGLVASYMFPKGGPDFIDAREENRLMGYSLWVSLCVHMLGAGVWWWLCHGRKRAKIA